MKKFCLVLGSGGAKGYVHLGVIKVLEKNGIRPDMIVGCSMGSMVGAFYAMQGELSNLIEYSTTLSSKNIVDIDPFALFHENFFAGRKVNKVLQKIFGETLATETKIPFVAISSSLQTGEQYSLSSGLLWENVRASISMPMVFPPYTINEIKMVDGGLLDAVPSDVARELMPDAIILAVDPLGDYKPEKSKIKLFGIGMNMINLIGITMTKRHPQCHDILIGRSQPDVGILEFNKKTAAKCIDRGVRMMNKVLPELKQMLEIK